MKKYEIREQKLLAELKTRNKLSTQEVSEMLNISESSTRRLFKSMEDDEKLIRVYGGVQSNTSNDYINDYSFNSLEREHYNQKQAIAAETVKLIEENDVLYLDCGTTLFQLAIMIVNMIEVGKLKNVRIITNSLANLEILHDHCQVLLVGGTYNTNRKDFAGYSAEIYIRQFNYKKAFLGADGYVRKQGFMASDDDIARLNQIAIEQSDETFVLLDSSKIGKFSYVKYADPSDISLVITDSQLSAEQRESLAQEKIEIRIG